MWGWSPWGISPTLFWIIGLTLFLAACTDQSIRLSSPPPPARPQIEVIAEGLLGPVGMALLPDGSLLVAEEGTGEGDNSGGVTLIQAGGQAGRLISGFPSHRDSGDLAGVNLVALAPGSDKLYIGNFGQGHLWTLALTEEERQQGLDLPNPPLTLTDLVPAMLPLNNVRLTNPFDLTFDAEGRPVVSDASGNGVAQENPDGTTRFFHRFAPLPNPVVAGDKIEAVPTGITRVGHEYYVTLTGGCPYPAQGGQLVAIDSQRQQRVIVDHLNMPLDVAQGPDGTVWLLEFARFPPGASCFDGQGYQPHTGRLSQLQAGGIRVMIDTLNFPGAVLPLSERTVYITEVFSGRVIRINFP